MEQADKIHSLHLQLRRSGNYLKTRAPDVFSKSEKVEFLHLVTSMRVPSGYNSTLTKHVVEQRLNGLKSHDHHVLLQQLLPAMIRNSLTSGVRETIIRLGNIFQRIYAKVIC